MTPQVFLAASASEAVNLLSHPRFPVDRTCLIAFPSTDGFNDFGTESRIEFLAGRKGEKPRERIMAKMLVAGHDSNDPVPNTSNYLKLRSTGHMGDLSYLVTALEGHFFLTALLDSDQYLKLIAQFGEREALTLLREVHDLGALNIAKDTSPDLNWFREKSQYGQSLLRLDSTFVAVFGLKNLLGRNLVQLAPPATVEIKDKSLEKGRLVLSFEPDALGTNRIAVLVGTNGTGKTRLLRALASQPSEVDSSAKLFVPSPLDDNTAFKPTPSTRVQHHPATQEGWAELTELLLLILRTTIDSPYERLARAVSGFIDLAQLRLPLKAAHNVDGLVASIVDGRSYIRLSGLLHVPEGSRTERFAWVDLDAAPLVLHEGKPRALSSGERALLGMAIILLDSVPQKGLVLLDEPELSLHPRMIAELMRLLGFLLEAREARCVIATHSLYVVRETPSSAVHVLKRGADESGTVDYQPMIETLGAGLTELSNVIFDDWEIQEYFEKRIEEFVARTQSQDEIDAASRDLGEAARSALYDQLRKDRR